MQSNWNLGLPWLPGGEQDFPLGAKATSYLPSATDLDNGYKNDNFELPDWMESRENLGLSDIDIFDDVKLIDKVEHNDYDQICDGITDMEDDYSQTIKPDDMLVPLSELIPETITPQGLGASSLPAVSSIPKISVKVSKVQAPIQQHGVRTIYLSGLQPTPQVVMPLQNAPFLQIPVPEAPVHLPVQQPQEPNNQIQYSGEIQPVKDSSICNADELLNELVEMVNNEPNGLTNLISSFDSSIVQAGMDDLLSQLESCEAEPEPEIRDLTPWKLEPAPRALHVPSPVPSVGSLSPHSTGDISFHQQTPTYTSDDSVLKLDTSADLVMKTETESLFLSLLSPSNDSLSVSSPSVTGDDESGNEYTNSEIHSYSRSPRKSKANRKTTSKRSAPYPEGKKERKKEQNKQAALRYRHKKKQEDDDIMAKMQAEEERQKQLKAKYANLKQELSCLKKIMREVFIAKGTLSPDAFKKK